MELTHFDKIGKTVMVDVTEMVTNEIKAVLELLELLCLKGSRDGISQLPF